MSLTYMALQFCIFQLTGEVGAEGHGVLRIETPPRKKCMHLARRQRLLKRLDKNHENNFPISPENFRNWFSCTAKGSIIWVSVEDYLLQYDGVSGECTTEIVPKHVQHQEKVGVTYRASFHTQIMLPLRRVTRQQDRKATWSLSVVSKGVGASAHNCGDGGEEISDSHGMNFSFILISF